MLPEIHLSKYIKLVLPFVIVFSLHATNQVCATESPVVLDARIAGDEIRTRFVADISRIVPIEVSLLDNPKRVIVDLPLVEFLIPESSQQIGRGLIKNWRFGLFSPIRSRIVLDLASPAKVAKSFILPPDSNQPARIVVELVVATQESFLSGKIYSSFDTVHSDDSIVPDTQFQEIKQDVSKLRPVIVIDPGHGGLDTGAVGSTGIMEKTIVLNFSSILKRKIEELGKFDVLLTRTSDQFLSLSDRVNFARNNDADLFISLHADSVRQKYVRGATVYTLSDRASDGLTAILAESENKSDLIGGVDLENETEVVGNILFDLAIRETRYFSKLYSRFLVDEISNSTNVIKNPHRSGGFLVLKAPDVPSVLLELGYLSNLGDEELLLSNEWQVQTAEAVAISVSKYFQSRLSK